MTPWEDWRTTKKLLCSEVFKELQNQVFGTAGSLDCDADGFAATVSCWVRMNVARVALFITLHHSSWKTLWGSLIGWNRPCEASFFFLNSQHQLFGFWTFWSSMSKFVLSLLIVLARKLWIIQRFLLFLWWKDINYNLQYFIGWETALWITKRRKKQINKEPVSHYWINLYAESATMGEVSRVRGSVDFP